MTWVWAALSWLGATLLGTLEVVWLAFRQGQDSQRLQQQDKELEAADAADKQVQQAVAVRDHVDHADAAELERLRVYYADLADTPQP